MIVKIGAGLLAIVLGTLSAGTLAVLQGGVATVYVENEEVSLWIPVPMAAVELAVFFVPDEEIQAIRRDLGSSRELILAAAGTLLECPDAVLVEVESADESVLIKKEGRNLLVDVRGSEKVRIKVPLDSLFRILTAVTGRAEITPVMS